jgi:hypothetical protein
VHSANIHWLKESEYCPKTPGPRKPRKKSEKTLLARAKFFSDLDPESIKKLAEEHGE